MEGLAKLANADWYQNDPQYRQLSDQSEALTQRHRALKSELSLKETQEKKVGSQVGGLLGGLTGSLIGRKINKPATPIVGGLAGAVGGGMAGSKLADMTFEDRHPKLMENETKAQMQKGYAQHRLFRYMDDKGYDLD